MLLPKLPCTEALTLPGCMLRKRPYYQSCHEQLHLPYSPELHLLPILFMHAAPRLEFVVSLQGANDRRLCKMLDLTLAHLSKKASGSDQQTAPHHLNMMQALRQPYNARLAAAATGMAGALLWVREVITYEGLSLKGTTPCHSPPCTSKCMHA